MLEEFSKLFDEKFKENAKEQKAILAQISTIIEKTNNLPVPIIKVNTDEISHEIKGFLNGFAIKVDNTETINEIKKEFESSKEALTTVTQSLKARENDFYKNQNESLSKHRDEILLIREDKNKAVEIRAENLLWGFTSSKSFFLSLSLLGIFIGVGFYFYFDAAHLQIENETLKTQIGNFQRSVENLRKSNSKLAKKHFY